MKILILIASLSLLLFTGCSKEDEHGLDDKERKAVAAQVAKNFVERNQKRVLVVKDEYFV
ncbi:hypothetical protein [Fictibacillus sp. KU28468]|uniref:hypothetical protein n=1 Tax=Fictibacillus sp. KU28468 TaxID=2991053 RepID=UPI00223E8311|nr:hypothetical protein [Fictibacillus sp. KU28468]UZJ79373.1 hypothetical protein OKX00_02480 [Fictibacillus sp. KU28468]